MNAEQWMELASTGTVVTACIPLGYQPTLPVPCIFGQELQIRFYYYRVSVLQETTLAGAPAYSLSFSTDGQVADFTRLENKAVVSPCAELTEEDFCTRQEAYMEMLDDFLSQNNGSVQELQKAWILTNPGAIQDELRERLA